MNTDRLCRYIIEHAERGECQCGKCFDKGQDKDAPAHSVNVQFFWVSAKNSPTKERLLELLESEYPSFDRLASGPSYIEIGGELGSQQIALLLIGLGELVGLWKAITPAVMGFTGEEAMSMAGSGMVMAGGMAA